MAHLAHGRPDLVEELGGEGPLADPRRVRLGDADDVVDARGADAGAGARRSGDRVAARDEGVGAEVDVEQRPLGALEEHVLALVQRRVDEQAGVADEGLEALPVGQQLLRHLGRVEHADLVALQQEVLLAQRGVDLAAQDLGVEQVLHADADARVFVHVAGSDAAAGGADLVLAELLLAGAVQQQVVRHDQVGVAAHAQVVAADTACAQRLQLSEQDVRVDHHAVADHAGLGLVQDARRDEVELELLAVADDGVAGVVAALEARHHVGLLGQQVRDLAFALVAPLGADHDGTGHCDSLRLVGLLRPPRGLALTAGEARRRPRGCVEPRRLPCLHHRGGPRL
ncbi:MAG: hypothetical protein BWY94_00927 [Actinobacteria bacterium ADurb.BinA094]|nr:MAG: hypothetical protein BWY94_00927 [Actinobacteria bacterium ADurb.BinA094]